VTKQQSRAHGCKIGTEITLGTSMRVMGSNTAFHLAYFDNLGAEGSHSWFILRVIVEVLQFSLLGNIKDASASFTDGG